MRKANAIAATTVVLLAGAVPVAWSLFRGDDPVPEARASFETKAVPGVAAQQAGAAGDTLSAAERAILAHRDAEGGPEQPIPFNHRFHVGELRIDCEYCHTGTRRSQVATMPPLSTCLGCHTFVGSGLPAIDSLRAFGDRGEPVPWLRVYKLPEFVQFRHRPHLRNGLECQECHGPVEEMDRIYQASSLTMGWCLSCHRGEPAATDVATDYQLVRAADIPESPGGRQPVGLYPRSIDQGYADGRAPDDCAACHH